MFRPVRKKKNEIDTAAVKALLHSARRGVLAVNGDDGYPYAIPVNYLYLEEENKIIFHGAKAGHKADSIKACDKVCFTVYGDEMILDEPWAPYLQSVVIFGRCHRVEDRDMTIELVRKLALKFFPDAALVEEEIASSGKAVQIYEIEIEHLSGKQIQER